MGKSRAAPAGANGEANVAPAGKSNGGKPVFVRISISALYEKDHSLRMKTVPYFLVIIHYKNHRRTPRIVADPCVLRAAPML
jgi:hypothetical protein